MDSEHPYGHLKGKISDYGHISKKKEERERRKKHNNEKDMYVF